MGCLHIWSVTLEQWPTSTTSFSQERGTISFGSGDQMLKKYELKVQVARWDREDNKELSFLGRVIRTTPTGIELEGDDKHVEMLEKEWDMAHCNPVATPYVKPTVSVDGAVGETEAKAMSPADATLYRRASARIKYVALDRPDLSFASRVSSSRMNNPKEGDDQLIDRKAEGGNQVPVPRRV